LNILGIEDYGIYNVVGGVVTMFSVFTISLSAAISRFITFELGQNNKERLSVIFSTSVNLLLLLSLIVVLAIEVVGVWFLNVKLNIPASRIDAANWVMQCSIIIFVLNLVSVPYNASIIAHERMGAFAYISILEVALKLVVAYSLYISSCYYLDFYLQLHS
jgi:O-antigen/teichoic acid export membrane protein